MRLRTFCPRPFHPFPIWPSLGLAPKDTPRWALSGRHSQGTGGQSQFKLFLKNRFQIFSTYGYHLLLFGNPFVRYLFGRLPILSWLFDQRRDCDYVLFAVILKESLEAALLNLFPCIHAVFCPCGQRVRLLQHEWFVKGGATVLFVFLRVHVVRWALLFRYNRG